MCPLTRAQSTETVNCGSKGEDTRGKRLRRDHEEVTAGPFVGRFGRADLLGRLFPGDDLGAEFLQRFSKAVMFES